MLDERDAYTPALIYEQLRDRLSSRTEKKEFLLRGIYKPTHRGRAWKGYFFDELADELGEAKVKIQVPEALRPSLKEGYVYTIRSFLSPRVVESYGHIEARVRVCDVLGEKAPRMSVAELERSQLLASVDRRAREVERVWRRQLEETGTLSLTLVTSSAGIAQEDLKRQLGPLAKHVTIEQRDVNLSQADSILSAAESAIEPVIALVRGGGPGLETFDAPQLATALTKLKDTKLLVSALGHAEDAPLVQQIADLAFDTPTDLGQHLYTLAEGIMSRFSTQRELEGERSRRDQLETDKQRLEEEREKLLGERENGAACEK